MVQSYSDPFGRYSIIPMLQQAFKLSNNALHPFYASRNVTSTELLEKCPALSFTDRIETISEEHGNPVRHRTEAFPWDKKLYRQ